ncbi:unnamed protein product [Heligmosomoides polygyrus]|uniref:FA domain-containing protein n=1 Tax=Heligmosomoides polygyrus TaxID=6339 RepID=A0A3P8DA69_HELPZ|nr:unnamed protein product [Heligmosomoides polygyrus]
MNKPHLWLAQHRATCQQPNMFWEIVRSHSRYGSTEQLQYKSPYVSSTSSFNSSSLYRTNANFPRAGSVGFSMADSTTRSYRDYTPTSSYSSATRIRPITSTTSAYKPISSFDYRSKTPGVERATTSRTNRFDRDCRSMSRTEKTPLQSSGEDDVEKTFEKLYYRYVKQDSTTDPQSPSEKGSLKHSTVSELTKPRTFISHSEAEEEDSSEEEQSPTELDSSFAEKLETMRHKKGDVSVTPSVSARNSPDATPKCSPMMLRKRDDEQTVEKKPVEEKTGAMKLDKVDSKSPAEVFREKHSNLEFIPVEVPSTTLKPVTSAMDKFLRRDSLTTKLSDAIEKKRASISNGDSGTTKAIKEVSPTPSRSISPNVAPLRAKNDLPSENLPNSTESPATKEQSPMPAKGSDSSHSAKVSLSLSASNNNGKNGASKNPADSNVGKDISLEAEENTETCQKSKEAPVKSRPKGAEPPKAALPIVVSTSVENAISTNAETPSKTEEPTVTVTIPLSGLKQVGESKQRIQIMHIIA